MKSALIVLTLLVPVAAAAQSAGAPLAVTAPAVSIPVGARVGEFATGYEDGGRRDPFASLVHPKRTAAATADGVRPRAGLASVALADVVVKGVVKSGNTMLAILESPGRQSFVTRVKDRLLDATVLTIDRDGVVFSDRSSGVPADVRKPLRPQGEEVR
jgi:hypothetical protein